MDERYDRKFEEMKKYIPFLENMIKRLETTSSSSNPRQAQLDKIRSLRDLLLDKKKRMKMENLLKCEQVLVNLYAKVEQRDTLPGIQSASEVLSPKDKSDLNVARNKLKTVVTKSPDPDTLPEIARANETEVVCVPGSKEPALFQRRPNKGSLSPTHPSPPTPPPPPAIKSPIKSSAKRNYTRVLVSPDRGLPSPPTEKQLFSRRSPPRPSRRHSPPYHKREKKKSSSSHSRKPKDLNITLKVPEERLNSLNTKDILSRIINCSDGDVDIATLRELRSQILCELKQTGANEDISDLILKSYKNKKRRTKKVDVEEGELSDSESEAIENIYGNLVVVEKDKGKDSTSSQSKISEQNQAPRKIQICLVINSDKEEASSDKSNKKGTDKEKVCDITDFEMFDDNITTKNSQSPPSSKAKEVDSAGQKSKPAASSNVNLPKSTEVITIDDLNTSNDSTVRKDVIDMNEFDLQGDSNNRNLKEVPAPVTKSLSAPFKANFYKPLNDTAETSDTHKLDNSEEKLANMPTSSEKSPDNHKNLENQTISTPEIDAKSKECNTVAEKSKSETGDKAPEVIDNTSTDQSVITTEPVKPSTEPKSLEKDASIPLLNEPTVQPATPDVVSEIDILQALKNEILSETITLPCAEIATPALHQPKLTKVSNVQELPKKRISIENYKQKTIKPSKPSLFIKDPNMSKEDSKKQSLKLTEKEVERFNLISKISLNDSSDEDDLQGIDSPDNLDLAPKSPDVEITENISVSPPVIIPVDPIKTTVVSSKADVDMRRLPMMSPNTLGFTSPPNIEPKKTGLDSNKPFETEPKWPQIPVDPRVRREKEPLLPAPPMPLFNNLNSSRSTSIPPNMTPNRTPNRTPNMTPNARSFEVIPNRPFETEDSSRKHVYAPMYIRQSNSGGRTPNWEPPEPSPVPKPTWGVSASDRENERNSRWEERSSRHSSVQRDDNSRSRYGDDNYDRSRNDRYNRDEYNRHDGPNNQGYYGRSECPATPTPSFGRGDAPATPSHYFGRSECPGTPIHPFGRGDAPLTPSHPFGRSEASMTPSHPFGRSEAPLTPSHPFGRSEAPMTPSHPFGRSDNSYKNQSSKYVKPQDPRLNRTYDNDSNNRRDHGSYNDRYRYNRNDPRNFNREQSVGGNDNRPYATDSNYNRDRMTRREPSVGRSVSKDYERDQSFSRERHHESDNSRSYADVGSRRNFHRESSVGRSVTDPRARASSVGRSYGRETNNKLSVESHAGRAFTIDTSVNSTFQKILDSHRSNDRSNDNSFDTRKQRASSVGRSLIREPSVGRNFPSSTFGKGEDDSRNKFRRAQSVGRDLSRSQSIGRDVKLNEKSFRDIKAEFESYRVKDSKYESKYTWTAKTSENNRNRDPRRRNSSEKPLERSQSVSRWNKTTAYENNLPTKKFNSKDPRLRREQKSSTEKYKNQSSKNRSDSRDRHSYGISSDNSVKSPVISSVKNYKIPKIKRPEPEPEVQSPKLEDTKDHPKSAEKDSKPKTTTVESKIEKKVKSSKEVTVDKNVKKDEKELNSIKDEKDKNAKKSEKEMKSKVPVENIERRVTRQSGKKTQRQLSKESDDDEIVPKTRKYKKVIYHSDSDENTSGEKEINKTASPKKSQNVKNVKEPKPSVKINENQNSSAAVINANQDSNKDMGDKNEFVIPNKPKDVDDNQETLNSSFGLDDIDLFADNIITDPVLDNINALIADLDNDLDTTKGDSACNNLFNEISIENMLEKITTSPSKAQTTSVMTADIVSTETVKKDLFDSLKESENCSVAEADKSEMQNDNSQTKLSEQAKTVDTVDKQANLVNEPQSTLNIEMDDKSNSEAVVSTSVCEDEVRNKDQSVITDKNLDGRSTPDSTNDAEMLPNNSSVESEGNSDSPKKSLSIEKQCEMHSDISSTHDSTDKPAKVAPEGTPEPLSQMDSFGSLLSILQDKSKIKELLSMLGGQSSENEKIKKKLEKLREIVSDDEDSNDDKLEEAKKSKSVPENKTATDIDDDNTIQNEPQKTVPNEQTKNKTELQKELGAKNSDTIQEDTQKSAANEQTTNNKELQKELQTEKDTEVEDIGPTESRSSVEIGEIRFTEPTAVEVISPAEKSSYGKKESEETETKHNSVELSKELDNLEESNDADFETPEPDDGKTQRSTSVKKNVKKGLKRLKSGKFKKGKGVKKTLDEDKQKRGTSHSEGVPDIKVPPAKKRSNELIRLQESIKEMFMSDEILNASGIRMCRLAKMVDDKNSNQKESSVIETEPVVVLEKVKHIDKKEPKVADKPQRKKPGPKPKQKPVVSSPNEKVSEDDKPLVKYKPGPKSKTRITQSDKDPYDFDLDSPNDIKTSEKAPENSSDSENESLASSKSFGSSELLVELKKKPKRKRGGWKSGIIKPKHKKKKLEIKRAESPREHPEHKVNIPDFNCFTDKHYCFSKNTSNYDCRLCESTHSGTDIVSHYKKHHPHSEIPLSRMSPATAKEAIEQCEEINFQAISKIPTEKYTCRFCYKEFSKKKASLEAFFWHVVSMHTGEYKQLCSECINEKRCPFNLDIPPPPKDIKGQLIGYICGKCNFTQVSLENLKTHVIVRHNDEQTEVYTINFAVMTKKTINSLVKRCSLDNQPRVTRSSRSNQSLTEASDDRSDVTESETEAPKVEKKSYSAVKSKKFSIESKITFETDDNASDLSTTDKTETSAVKLERDDEEDNQQDAGFEEPINDQEVDNEKQGNEKAASDDITNYPHFKIRYTSAGSKEYVCCINGIDNHYKTGLLISMKKHVQLKHSEIWDGYCFVCKVIVTPQGQHKFSDCLQHFLDNHIDNFPVLEVVEPEKPVEAPVPEVPVSTLTPKTYINVRPLSELVSSFEPPPETPVEAPVALPVIENVVSLMPSTVEPARPSPTYPVLVKEPEPPKEFKYEEAQAEVMVKKHQVVLQSMITPEKLIHVFKCAGRFCSFTTDSAEDALLHASTHQRVGGIDALLCAYCDFDSSGNSIDLVSHVFKNHGRCQFACGQCFYRAAASQLVGAHMARVHNMAPGPKDILKATNTPAVSVSPEENLTRDAAVPLYVCKQSENNETCTFRTVTHNKFWEHMNQKHPSTTNFECYICNITVPDTANLIVHLKTHGLKLYHCTLCVFGADNEPELLSHASAKHPAKVPQAYIRTICGMTGTGNFKILPLVELKKNVPPSEGITANRSKENPVREAERALELEKLIGDISLFDTPVESTPVQPELELPATVTEIPHNLSNEDDASLSALMETSTVVSMATLRPVPPLAPITTPPRTVTPAPTTDQNLEKQKTPVLKVEPVDATPEKFSDDVICLDSDDEDSKQGIINLSDDENPTTSEANNSSELRQLLISKKVSPANLYTCAKCQEKAVSHRTFKKHLHQCYTKAEHTAKCAHCDYLSNNVNKLLVHYNKAHSAPPRYSCGICSRMEPFLSSMKKHVKTHNVSKYVVTSKYGEYGEVHYVVGGTPDPSEPKPTKPVRRKLSTANAPPTVPTKRRYGPSDIDKLPINPILDESVHCDLCEFHTKVRLNMVRHLQLHAEQQPVPQTAPVNPVPHLETNEKHFDKMVNLASSSIAVRAPEKPAKEAQPAVVVSPEMAARYPKFVPERHRLTCGAQGCSYISLDEGMLRCHWETLHSGTTDYHCVHCPPYQHLDKSKPLTASRIIAHLKMHDIRLYACSACPYYHYKRQVLEKHLSEVHKGGQVLVVREEASVLGSAISAAPTMDLKPWQCGLCKYKSMLRPEVIEHCFKFHQSKMQYKCAYCPFRTSTPENVTKHQSTSHNNRPNEIFYFYYQEGSIPNSADGTPLWQSQRQKAGLDTNQVVKSEIPEPATQPLKAGQSLLLPNLHSQIAPSNQPIGVNLNLVKQEVDTDLNPILMTVEDLCKKFGEFCEPNGLNYKCSLCQVIVEDTKDAMQSHLYEELRYRKWGCRLCSYKAFHQAGLKEHMWTEHRQNQEPINLPIDINVESWVTKLLEYQEDLIKKNREKLAQQKIQVERPPAPSTSKPVEVTSVACKLTLQELEKHFGSLGSSSNMMYSCPKCTFKTKEELSMQNHLEMELTKIRWCCSACPQHFATYHEAQFHCKVHAGQPARPLEALRDPSVRAAWTAAAIRVQKLSMNYMPVAATPTQTQEERDDNDSEENSLLVVRYEENVPTPEEETLRRKRPASTASDSDDDSLVIDETATKKSFSTTKCPYCDFATKYPQIITGHILRHYNLKPFTCPYCNYNNHKNPVLMHVSTAHPDKRVFANKTQKPTGPPTILDLSKQSKKSTPFKKEEWWVCLTCERVFTDTESATHAHDDAPSTFVKKGEMVVKCSECLLLFLDVICLQKHNTESHPGVPINYSYYKLLHDTRDTVLCLHCDRRYAQLKYLKCHHANEHSSLSLKYVRTPYVPGERIEQIQMEVSLGFKRKADDANLPSPKRYAKKSTTKLPDSKAVAKKSTSKLPFFVESESESEIEDEFSYYGTKPQSLDELSNVTTLMSFGNAMVPFTLKNLREMVKIEPKVVIKDCKK